ncbi:hypothetical protein LCGC14_1024490 [marine sediment metagenome]|uniref:O-antigen ligase-related domain-containing protein n=1 Tax=marine sediment metagenome TaxID=412755 RepID=A0A0F9NI35_9ZZZZ
MSDLAAGWAWEGQATQAAPAARGRAHFRVVFTVLVIYGIAALFVPFLEIGHYVFKLIPCVFIFTLCLTRENRLALLGCATPLYFALKTSQFAGSETNFMVPMATALVVAAWLVAWVYDSLVLRRQSRVRASLPMALLGIWMLLGMVGVVKAVRVTQWFWHMGAMFSLLAAFALALRSPVTTESVKRMVLGMAAAIVAFNMPFAFRALIQYGPGALARLNDLRAEYEATLVGSETGSLLMLFAFCIGLAVSRAPRSLRMAAVLFGLTSSGIMQILYVSRAGFAAAGGVVVLGLLFSKRKIAAIVVAAMLVLAVMIFLVVKPEYWESVQERFGSLRSSARTRAAARSHALRKCTQNPVLGLGVGQYRYHSPRLVSAHNDIFNVSAEMGLPGAFLYICLVGVFLKKGWSARKIKDPLRQGVVLGCTLAGLGYLAYTQFQPLYQARGGMLLFGLLGLLYVCAQPQPQPEDERSEAPEHW